ncbi:MAG: MetQ/NlpA family ABC transporter substrate-binding protein [Longicatena sp.]
MKKLCLSFIAVGVLAGLSGCGSKSNNTIRIGASTTPHAEIIKEITPALEKEGYKVELTEFTDYVKPNQALVNDNLDANFFQHKPYMEEWAIKAKAEDKITSVFAVHFEPLGIYSNTNKNLKDIKQGAKIAIPNDPTNGGRALQLLNANGVISLKDGLGIKATKNDITENKQKVEIIEMAAEACAKNISDVDYAVVNGNNALLAKISDKLIITESKESEAAQTYANIIAVQPKHADDAKIKALIKALNSEDVKAFINEKYKGIVVPLVPTK